MEAEIIHTEEQAHGSPAMRLLFFGLGTLSLALCILGIDLPVLPTTPFLLLAASCDACASTRLYNALLKNRLCGPTIRQWRQRRRS